MVSEHYVPNTVLKSIDRKSSLMMSSGLHHFYTKYSEFMMEMRSKIEHREENDEESQALTMEQLQRPLVVIFYLWGGSLGIFIIEILIYHFKKHFCCR